jgi:transposase
MIFAKRSLEEIDISIIETTSPEIRQLFLLFMRNAELLEKRCEDLEAENALLKAQLNQNSNNSSRPPSSDGYKKIAKKHKQESEKAQGGQPGHKGDTQQQVAKPDEIIEIIPPRCNCGYEYSKQDELVQTQKRQVFDIPPPRIWVRQYQALSCKCPKCGQINKGVFPDDVNAPVQYGKQAKALVVLLNNEYKTPLKKIGELFNILYGCEMNESTVIAAIKDCYENLSESETLIKNELLKAQVGHVDETGIRINKTLQWLHVFSNTQYTHLFVHAKRGKEAIESEQSVIPDFKNFLVHDCWSSYFDFTALRHVLCNAHIIRELQAVIDNNTTQKAAWAKGMQKFLLDMNDKDFSQCVKEQDTLHADYLAWCEMGLAAEPPSEKTQGKRGKPKNSKARNLLLRLIEHKDSILAFAFNENVPFTNNLAERDLRPAKIKLKISNSFRAIEGAKYYARIQGFISTARKQGKNILNELYNTFNGYNFITQPICIRGT